MSTGITMFRYYNDWTTSREWQQKEPVMKTMGLKNV